MSRRARSATRSFNGGLLLLLPIAIAGFIALGTPAGSTVVAPSPSPTPSEPAISINHIPADRFTPDDTTIESCGPTDDPCFEQAFANLAYAEGGKAAIAYWKTLAPQIRNVEANCHQITHLIGAGSLAKAKGDIGVAFADGDESCWSGYYHGIMQAAIGNIESDEPAVIAPKVAAMCASASIREVEWIAWQCVHGIGHGLLISTNYDLPKTMETCLLLPTGDAQVCANGAFMENVTPSLPGSSPWLNNQADYPCTIVPESLRGDCYGYSGHRSLMITGGDYRAAGGLCATFDPRFREVCFSSIGHMAAAAAVNAVPGIAERCAAVALGGGDVTGSCWVGAAIDVYAATVEPARAADVCVVATSGVSECYRAVGGMLRSTARPGEDPVAACDRYTPTGSARAACREGAGGAPLP